MQLRRLSLIALVAALCVVAVPSVANAAPCWQRVITDWTKDGVINGHYSPKCLRKAYKKTPEDLRDYSGILDDINAALIATGSQHKSGGSGPGGPSSTANGPNSTPAAIAAAKKKEAQRRAKAAQAAVPGAGTAASTPGHDRSIPLPLIILGAVVLAGALAGAAPSLITRSRGRFPRLRANPDSVRPPA